MKPFCIVNDFGIRNEINFFDLVMYAPIPSNNIMLSYNANNIFEK